MSWDPFHERFFLHNTSSVEISFCCHISCYKAIAIAFCTRHDSYAKRCSDMIPYKGVPPKPILHRIWITMEESFVMGLRTKCTQFTELTHIYDTMPWCGVFFRNTHHFHCRLRVYCDILQGCGCGVGWGGGVGCGCGVGAFWVIWRKEKILLDNKSALYYARCTETNMSFWQLYRRSGVKC